MMVFFKVLHGVLKTVYLWIAAYVSHLVISYHDFLILFAPTS